MTKPLIYPVFEIKQGSSTVYDITQGGSQSISSDKLALELERMIKF